MIRTSETHPLWIGAVDAGPGRGQIGITFAPGKHDRHGPWARDLTVDLDAIAAWNAKVIVTLIEPHEISRLCISNLGPEIQRRGMEWVHMPIIDVRTPDPSLRRNGQRSAVASSPDSTPAKTFWCIAVAASGGREWSRRDCWSRPASIPRTR
jgi:hypothetical protein